MFRRKMLRTVVLSLVLLSMSQTAQAADTPPVRDEPAEAADAAESVRLRGGTLAVAGEAYGLTFGDKPLTVPDGYSLSFVETFTIGDNDVVLVMKSSGGTGLSRRVRLRIGRRPGVCDVVAAVRHLQRSGRGEARRRRGLGNHAGVPEDRRRTNRSRNGPGGRDMSSSTGPAA